MRDDRGQVRRAARLRCTHFICDLSGSFCEVADPWDENDASLRTVIDNTLLLYIAPTTAFVESLIERAQKVPKPLYYRKEFLGACIQRYLSTHGVESPNALEPDAFIRWVYPHLLAARLPRYEKLAEYGYTVSVEEISRVTNEREFLDLVAHAIDRQSQLGADVAPHLSRLGLAPGLDQNLPLQPK